MGGIGKTTISRAICNQMVGDSDGKVCYIEFGGSNSVQLQKTVLQELTGASPAILSNKYDKLADLLKQRMDRQKVFLVLDNVWDNQIQEAQMYLNAGYHDGSNVLITSRSLDTLNKLKIQESDCMEMPNLEREGAIDLFLHYTGRSWASIKDAEWKIVKRRVKECSFLTKQEVDSSYKIIPTHQYLPLALKVLGNRLGSISHEVWEWEESLEKLKADKFNMFKEKIHPVFSVLRLGYDALCMEEQHIFLDLALIWVPDWRWKSSRLRYEWEWLCLIHRKTEDDMKQSVNALQRKGLLDSVFEVDELKYNIHDLYLEFAKAESQSGSFEGRRFLINEGGTDVPYELLKYPLNGLYWPSLEGPIIHNSEVQSLKRAKLHLCKNMEVLDLHGCEELEEVDVTGMDNLRCEVISECYKLGRLIGFEKLSSLVILRFSGSTFSSSTISGSTVSDSIGSAISPEFLHDLSSLTALQVLLLEDLCWSKVDMFPPNLSGCTNLQELTLSNSRTRYARGSTSSLVDLGKHLPKSLSKINFSNCPKFLGGSPISSMRSLTNLQDLNFSGCEEIQDLTSLCELILLQRLFVAETGISELPDGMWKLKQLRFLDVSLCKKLTKLARIAHATTLQHVDAHGCQDLRELPDDFSCLQKLEMVDLQDNDLICTLPNDYERLAGYSGSGRILKVRGCWGLIVPLVKELRWPQTSHGTCVNSCNIGRNTMKSWIDRRKTVNGAAYDLLKSVIPDDYDVDETGGDHLPWLGKSAEVVDFVIRALCEHDDRARSSGTDRLTNVVAEVTYDACSSDGRAQWWVVVATAPCTFGVLTEKAKLIRDRHLLYIMVHVVPRFLSRRSSVIKRGNVPSVEDDESDWWLVMAMKALLQKCKEGLATEMQRRP